MIDVDKTITEKEEIKVVNFDDADNEFFETDDADVIQLFKISKSIIEKAKQPIPPVPILLSINETPVLFKNSITSIQGPKSSYKSRIIELLISALINAYNNSEVKRNPLFDYFIIMLDTERDARNDLPKALEGIKSRINIAKTEHPDNYIPFSFAMFLRNKRMDLAKKLINGYKTKHPDKHLIIILDVSTDFLNNFNDPAESMEVVDYFNSLINEFDISIITIIHENPSPGAKQADKKGRGHFGTELMNKSSCIYQTYVKDDLIHFAPMHLRHHKKIKRPFVFEYDQAINGLKLTNSDPEVIELNIIEEWKNVIVATIGEKTLSTNQIATKLADRFNVSISKARQKFEDICINHNDFQELTLNKSTGKNGKTINYCFIRGLAG